jgi:hypothetical protein
MVESEDERKCFKAAEDTAAHQTMAQRIPVNNNSVLRRGLSPSERGNTRRAAELLLMSYCSTTSYNVTSTLYKAQSPEKEREK